MCIRDRAFRIYTGLRIGDYITRLRIDEAAGKLAAGDPEIIDVAYACGFESLRTFRRAFTRFTGTTPRDFRKKLKE